MERPFRNAMVSVGIVSLIAVMDFVIWFVLWAAGGWVMDHLFGWTGTRAMLLWGIIVGAALLVANIAAFWRMRLREERGEMVTRAFFSLFQKDAIERLLKQLSRAPGFSLVHYWIATAALATIALLIAFYVNYGYLLALVFFVLILWMWHSRGRSLRLVASFYHGNNLIAQGRPEDALYIAGTMLRIRPRSVGGQWLRGNALFAMGRYSDAAGAYQKAMRINSETRRYLLPYVALAMHRMGLLDNAVRAYREALDRTPDAPEAVYGLACALAARGDYDDSIKSLRRAVELGYITREILEADSDLDPLRTDPEFQSLMRSMAG